ncbi:MAG TPA: aldo/keto reductase [Steroidobacteraceae bacterium]|jgi:aryl-alcohol dehydrogenase-like predicted oxidoreductase|nr:aldo/keto reductase [Steroidobacteraceae bacterium]
MTSRIDTRVSRRRLLQTGLVGGAGLALASRLAWAAEAASLPLITRSIPSTGEKIPVIGVGTNAYGVAAPEEVAAIKAVLQRMPDLGGRIIDTARGYGSSEVVIGQLLAELGNRDKFFLCTKTPLSGDVSGGAPVLDESFKRLKVDRIDLLQVHNFLGLDELMPHFLEYKQAKKIRYIGVTTSVDAQYPNMLAAMNKYKLDFIQVDYSIDNRGAADQILPLAQEKGIAVLNNVPFGGRGRSVFPRLAGKALPDFAKEIDATTWAQFMLKYNLSNPAITGIIPGTTTLEYLVDNQQGARGRVPDAALRKRMEEFWSTI